MHSTKGSHVDNFIKSLLSMHEIDNNATSLAYILLEDFSYCKMFFSKFMGRGDHILDDLLEFRAYRISISDIDFDKMSDIWDNIGSKSALQKTFLQPFTDEDVSFVRGKMKEKNISLYDLYSKFKKDESQNVMKYLL